jgi:hypothetical protein
MDGKYFINHFRNNEIQLNRVMLMLYDLEVLQSDCERIGDPVALPLTDIINSGTNTNRLGIIRTMLIREKI